MTAADLFAANQRLAYHVARRFSSVAAELHIDQDDLEQTARVGLWRAAQEYRPETGYRFSTLAVTTIRNTVINFIHQQARQRRIVFVEGAALDNRPAAVEGLADMRMDVAAIVEALPMRRDRELVRRYFGLGRKPEMLGSIAKRFGERPRVASLRLARVSRQLRTMAGGYE